jgi:hypothetical protein
MANSYLFERLRGTAAVNKLQIATLIGSLSRSVALLTVDIEHEETRAGVRDLSDPAYPVLARSLRVRRENIRATIAMLENLRSPKASTHTHYDRTRGGVGDHLAEHRARGVFSY